MSLPVPDDAQLERTVTPEPVHRTTQGKARKRALDILFEAELRGEDVLTTLSDRTAAAEPPVREYTTRLVQNVQANRTSIDARIRSALARGWTLERLPRVDRITLRIAICEIDVLEVAPAVAVAEALSLVGELSTDDSPAFVHGVLAALLRD